MTEPNQSDEPTRKEGTVKRVLDGYGFISAEGLEEDLYFKSSWFRGYPALEEGEAVTFVFKRYGGNLQAHYVKRINESSAPRKDQGSVPFSEHPFQWAYFGHMPTVLEDLAGLALPERWDFGRGVQDPAQPLPILSSYLFHTFGKLVLDKKIKVSDDGKFAAYNTGLVDSRYEMIYAFFKQNDRASPPWRLSDFCIAGEGWAGQNLVRHFKPLPERAHYFDEPSDLFYDIRAGEPEIDWRHCVIQRLGRYPRKFLEDHWPATFPKEDVLGLLSKEERKRYFEEFGEAVEQDQRTYRMIINRVKDAVSLAIKRASWNFKTAVPQYYPRIQRLQLLLPICLVSDDQPDMALAVEKTKVGGYLGHTVLPLNWAYRNARLICRPDSDWLEPLSISGEDAEDDDE